MLVDGAREPHFSVQVREVQSAYLRAAGSVFARKPTRCGERWSLERPEDTSDRRDLATVPARMTLHEARLTSVLAMVVLGSQLELYKTR